MLSITLDEAEAREWLDVFYAKKKAELKESQERSSNADYDFY